MNYTTNDQPAHSLVVVPWTGHQPGWLATWTDGAQDITTHFRALFRSNGDLVEAECVNGCPVGTANRKHYAVSDIPEAVISAIQSLQT